MKAPEGMKWIDVTYEALRVEQPYYYESERSFNSTIKGETSMQILIDEDNAEYLATSPVCDWTDSFEDSRLSMVERILRGREELCRGKYVEGSIKNIRIMEDDE